MTHLEMQLSAFSLILCCMRRPGGKEIMRIFDALPKYLSSLPYDDILHPQLVETNLKSAEGYKTHLLAPNKGVSHLIKSGLSMMKSPAEVAMDQVHKELRVALLQALRNPLCLAIEMHPELKQAILEKAQQTLGEL